MVETQYLLNKYLKQWTHTQKKANNVTAQRKSSMPLKESLSLPKGGHSTNTDGVLATC